MHTNLLHKHCKTLRIANAYQYILLCIMEPSSLQLVDANCKPVNAHTCTVPRSLEQQLKQNKGIALSVDIGVLDEDYSSEWTSPIFAIPGKNEVVIDFRNLNLLWKRQPFPILKIGDMIRSMEGFTFDTLLHLNVSYYHIKLDEDAQSYLQLYSHGIGEN
jgi:hypothetical protein